MFDEQDPQPKPDQSPAPVEDMFEGLTSPSPVPRERLAAPESPSAAMPYSDGHGARFGVVKVALIIALTLALVSVAAYGGWRIMSQSPEEGGVVQSVPDDGVVTEEETPSSAAATDQQNDAVANDTKTFLDSDGDGLTNAEELEVGTSSDKADTDSDGLGDREEVKVYDTNPRKADTDGDTFLDGQEVSGGYNPNGEGRLFVVPNP